LAIGENQGTIAYTERLIRWNRTSNSAEGGARLEIPAESHENHVRRIAVWSKATAVPSYAMVVSEAGTRSRGASL